MSKSKRMPVICLIGALLLLTLAIACGAPATTTSSTVPSSTAPSSTAPSPTTTMAPPKTLYIGGTFALTGAYAEDCAAILSGFQDYAKYVNDNHVLAPWYQDLKIPTNISFEVKWADDKLDPNQALSIYDTFKSQGLLVERVSGSPQALALKQKLIDDRIGATSQATGPYLLTPPGTIFANYPIYTDSMGAVAQWFLSNWKDTTRKPKYAFLTADNAMGQSVVTPELQAYMEKLGFEFAGTQTVPLVPTSPPTTQLTWLKQNNVDLTLGVMINPGSQPTIKEADRLDMGPTRGYKITFAFATPSHLQVFLPSMGADLSEGVVLGGGYAPWEDTGAGIKFANDLQNKYRPDKKVTHIMYVDGIVEAMTQVNALRLAMETVPADQLKAADVLEKGFFQIKDMDTGGITSTPLTYGPTDIQGIKQVRVQQVQNGKIVQVGLYPVANIYKR